MVDNIKYANAMAEVLYYLKGIRQKDIDKIPKKLIEFLKENASKDYICDFDYTKPLKELELQEETKGLIAIICLKYWCETEQQRLTILNQLEQNEILYEEEIKNKYDVENIFKPINSNIYKTTDEQLSIIEYKKNIWQKLLDKIKQIFRK